MGQKGFPAKISALNEELTNLKAGTSGFVAVKATEIWSTGLSAKIIALSPGSATPVNYWIMTGSGADAALELSADGSDTDIDISLVPKGDGRLCEAEVPVALNCGSSQADTEAADLAALKTDFNALLAKLRTARVLDT